MPGVQRHQELTGETAMVEYYEEANGRILILRMSGKLTKGDYRSFLPEIEHLIQRHGRIRLLFQMHDFQGWEPEALWEDIKLGFTHFSDFERVAFAGHRTRQEGSLESCKPLHDSKVRHFDEGEFAQAVEWIWGQLPMDSIQSTFLRHFQLQGIADVLPAAIVDASTASRLN
jgi:hypothetical protein